MRLHQQLIYLFFLFLNISPLSGQIQGKLELLDDNKTYRVSIVPEQTLPLRTSRTNSGQITLRAPAGGLDISNFQSISGNWELVPSIAESPPDNPGFSYYFIELKLPLNDIPYETGVDIILFTFENNLPCIGDISIIDNQNDPFLPPNSLNLNVGNLFTVLGYGPTNAYIGNITENAPCPEALNATANVTLDQLNCPKDLTTMEVNILGGEPPYTIIWTNSRTGETDSIISNQLNTPVFLQNIAAGSYNINIKDTKNVGVTLTQTVSAPDPIAIKLKTTNTNCAESQNGLIEITGISGGTGSNYQYAWSNGLNGSMLINNLSEGAYTLTVTDENGCTSSQEVYIKTDGWIEVTSTTANVNCFGMEDGNINLVATGKNPPFSFQWEGNGASGTTNNISGLTAGLYNLTIYDATGICNQTETIEIKEPIEITASAFMDTSSMCELETESIVTIENVQNNRGPVRYSTDGITFKETNVFTLSAATSYTLTVRDEEGCTADIDIEIPAPSGLEVSLPPDLTLRLGDELELNAILNATTSTAINWTPADGLSCTDCPFPKVTPTRTTTYTITVSDDNGCVKEASVIVYLTSSKRVYIPNAFSPNGDEINDRFTIFTGPEVFSVNTLQLYDRWGDKVYQSPDGFVPGDASSHGWDGWINGKEAPVGLYIFLAEVTFINGETENFKGEVNLVR